MDHGFLTADPDNPRPRRSTQQRKTVSEEEVRAAAAHEIDRAKEAFASFERHPFLTEIEALAEEKIAEINAQLTAGPMPIEAQNLLFERKKLLEDITFGRFYHHALSRTISRTLARSRAELSRTALLDQAAAREGADRNQD